MLFRSRDYGASTLELLASYDPNLSLWKTSQHCLDGDLQTFSETWPRSGMMRNGIAYRLPPLVPLTDAIECGLLPTPMARDWRSGKASPATLAKNSRPLSERIGGLLNPAWIEWLMGFPTGWTELQPSEMPLYRRYRNYLAAQSSKQKV